MMSNDRPNLLSKFVPPLDRHGRRGCDDDEIDSPAEQQLAHDKPRLDRLAEADIVGDQKVHTRQSERFSQRQQLIGVKPNAGPKRRLQKVSIGRCRRAPADRSQVRRENFWIVGRATTNARPGVSFQYRRADFGIPKDFDLLALSVIGNGRQPDRGQARFQIVHGFNEPGPPSRFDGSALFMPNRITP